MDARAGHSKAAVVITVVGAVMLIHELMRHERLVSDVGVADELRHWTRREIKLSPHPAAVVADVMVVEQVLLGVVAIVAIAQGVVFAVTLSREAAVVGTAVDIVMVMQRMSVSRAGSASPPGQFGQS